MHKRSLFAKLRDAVLGPPLPERYQHRVVIPFYVRLWEAIRPPVAPGRPLGMNRSQLRLMRITMGAVLLLAAGAGVYYYAFAGREQRSMAAFQNGLKAVARLDYDQSIARFTEAISIWPGNALAHLNRGNAQAAIGNPVEAKRDWDHATQLNPDLPDAYTARGTQDRIEGKTEEALTELSRSIQLHPTVDAYYQRGQVYAMLRDYPKAIEDYDRSITEKPEAPYVYRARAVARTAIGDEAGAAEDRAIADGIEHIPSNAFSVR